MKKLKTRNEYKASNVVLNTDTMEAYSYNWWCFLRVIGGKVVFNDYRYSASTSGHQSKVRSKLYDLGIKIDLIVYMHSSLTEENFYKHALRSLYETAIGNIVQNNTKRVQKKTKEKNLRINKQLREEIKLLREIGCEFSFTQMYDIYRLFKKNRDFKEDFISTMRKIKGKVFWDNDNKRVKVVKGTNLRVQLKYIDPIEQSYGRKVTGKTVNYGYFKNHYKPCQLTKSMEY